MKLGIAGLLPRRFTSIDSAAVRAIKDLGFSGGAVAPTEPPTDISTEQARDIAGIFAGEGVDLVEFGQYGTTFVHPDVRVRRDNIEVVRQASRVASAAGCPAVIVGIGSLNPRGNWFPHRDNFTAATRDRLIATLAVAVHAAEDEGVLLALECHVTTTLRDAATARAVLDAVGSPSLKIHLDPVNWITLDTVFNSGPAIHSMVATLGAGRISGAHSKGAVVEDRLITHLNETYTGDPEDLIDHRAVLTALQGFPEATYVVIEHLMKEQMPVARDYLHRVAAGLGVAFAPPV